MSLLARSFSSVTAAFQTSIRRSKTDLGQPETRRSLIEFAVCLLFAVVVMATSMSLKILNPTFIDWCLNWDSDLSNYYLSFAYYRHSPWHFPNITHIDHLFHPLGADVVLMDGLPLLSVPFKIVQGLLPERFQFFGIWLLCCHWLQAFVGLRFLKSLNVSEPLAWCGAFLLCVAPTLVLRHGHTQLCAHFLLLASIYAAVRAKPSWLLVALPTLALCIHAYWVAICFPLWAIGHLRFIREPGAIKRMGVTGLCFGGSLWLLGYFSMHATQSGGFGAYVSDLSTFYNSMGLSAFLPDFPMNKKAEEGMAYLGVGGLALVIPFFVGFSVSTPKPARLTLYAITFVCFALALYAVSPMPQLYGERVGEFDTITRALKPISSRFRAGGRFIWPLHYLILIFGLKGVDWLLRSRPRLLPAVAVGLALVQSADLAAAYAKLGKDERLTARSDFSVPDAVREQLTAESRYLILSPPVKVNCGGKHWRSSYYAYALFGAEHGLTTTSDFGSARMSVEDRREVCRTTERLINSEHGDVIVVER